MKYILEYIDQKKKDFSQLPFFDYLRDGSISPLQRLAFSPCIAPFIMSFGDLNKYVFRDENSTDRLQLIINKHTYEDDHHWTWFLEDLEKLGLNPVLNFRDALMVLWNEQTTSARQVINELYRLTYQCSPLQKLVVIEAAEATGNAFLAFSSNIIRPLERSTQQKYRYFGSGHLLVDTGHTYCSPEVKAYIESINLNSTEQAEKRQIVDNVFEVFSNFTQDLLTYAKSHPVSTVHAIPQPPKRVGTCLLDAGLITLEQLDFALAEQQTQELRLGEILAHHGWVKQKTVDFMVENMMAPHNPLSRANNRSPVYRN